MLAERDAKIRELEETVRMLKEKLAGGEITKVQQNHMEDIIEETTELEQNNIEETTGVVHNNKDDIIEESQLENEEV